MLHRAGRRPAGRARLTGARAQFLAVRGVAVTDSVRSSGQNARARRRVEVAMAAREFPIWDAGQLPLFT